MNIQNQIKARREQLGLTQEELGDKMYVSRQTISNWETGHSYPDLDNLLRLSVLFDASLDDLVKGDVETMKQKLDYAQTTRWSWLMTVMLGLAAFSIGPSLNYFDWWGLLIPVVLVNIAFYAGIKVERWKGAHQLKTYSEIVAFTQNHQVMDEAEQQARQAKDRLVYTATMLAFVAGSVGLALLGFWLFKG